MDSLHSTRLPMTVNAMWMTIDGGSDLFIVPHHVDRQGRQKTSNTDRLLCSLRLFPHMPLRWNSLRQDPSKMTHLLYFLRKFHGNFRLFVVLGYCGIPIWRFTFRILSEFWILRLDIFCTIRKIGSRGFGEQDRVFPGCLDLLEEILVENEQHHSSHNPNQPTKLKQLYQEQTNTRWSSLFKSFTFSPWSFPLSLPPVACVDPWTKGTPSPRPSRMVASLCAMYLA